MKSFKAPGGDLNIWSVLWFLAGTGTLVISVIYPEKLGLMGMLFGAALAIPSALLWWGSYRAANFLILLMLVGIVLGFINLMAVDATYEQKMPRIIKMVLSSYFIARLWRWSDQRNPQSGQSDSDAS